MYITERIEQLMKSGLYMLQICYNMPELVKNQPDACSIGLNLAPFWHILQYLQGMFHIRVLVQLIEA